MHMMIGESAHHYGGKRLLNSLSKRGLAISYSVAASTAICWGETKKQ